MIIYCTHQPICLGKELTSKVKLGSTAVEGGVGMGVSGQSQVKEWGRCHLNLRDLYYKRLHQQTGLSDLHEQLEMSEGLQWN